MKKRRIKRKLPLSYRVFGFPAHITTGGVNINIYDNLGLCAENYGTIHEYTDRKLSFAAKNGMVIVAGERFSIEESTPDKLFMSGIISSVVFDYANCRDEVDDK